MVECNNFDRFLCSEKQTANIKNLMSKQTRR